MRYSTIIIYILTIISIISVLGTLIWTVLELFIGTNNKLAGYSLFASFFSMLLMFKLSMRATDKEMRKEIDEHRQ